MASADRGVHFRGPALIVLQLGTGKAGTSPNLVLEPTRQCYGPAAVEVGASIVPRSSLRVALSAEKFLLAPSKEKQGHAARAHAARGLPCCPLPV